jgi:hypothetical protein
MDPLQYTSKLVMHVGSVYTASNDFKLNGLKLAVTDSDDPWLRGPITPACIRGLTVSRAFCHVKSHPLIGVPVVQSDINVFGNRTSRHDSLLFPWLLLNLKQSSSEVATVSRALDRLLRLYSCADQLLVPLLPAFYSLYTSRHSWCQCQLVWALKFETSTAR